MTSPVAEAPRPPNKWTIAALTSAFTVGAFGASLMPVLLYDYRRELGLSEAQAGSVAALHLLVAAVATAALAGRAGRPGRARMAGAGFIVAATGFALSGLAAGALSLSVGLVVAGAGAGVAAAAGGAAFAATRRPERSTAISLFWNTIAVAVALVALPLAANAAGKAGSFGLLALACVLMIPLLRALPDASSTAEQEGRLRDAPRRGFGLLVALGAAVYVMSETAVWAFSGEIAVTRVGIGEDSVGLLLAAVTLAGLLGAAAAGWADTRFGRALPFFVIIALSTACKAWVVTTHSPLAFTAAQLVWGATLTAAYAYFVGISAALDGLGRWSAFTTGAFGFGAALGPIVAGVVVEASGYAALGVGQLLVGIAVLVLMVWVAVATDREARQPRSGAGAEDARAQRLPALGKGSR